MNDDSRRYLGTEPIGRLMRKFALPSIIAMLVSALYNIVDQIFIGNYVGVLGNSASNIVFPVATACTALGLLFGVGGAANFNIAMGRHDYTIAPYYIGNAAAMHVLAGSALAIFIEVFLFPLLRFFGSTEDVLPYAAEYLRIMALGIPFLLLTTGGGHLLRADGNPNMTMFVGLFGAVLNVFLDAWFVIGLGWGMKGAAWASIIGQILSGCIVIVYLLRFTRSCKLKPEHFLPRRRFVRRIMALGTASCLNQVGMMLVQIVLNNSLKYYGALSIYGESIPIACAGIVTKANQVLFSIVIGLAQGSQPIESFNFGARQYDRVRSTYLLTLKAAACISVFAFILFQTIPDKILRIFGEGSPEYFSFGVKFFRIFLFCTWANCIQPATAQFFASIARPGRGAFVSLTRQVLFFLPLVLILPRFMGIDGILYAGCTADGAAALVAALMVRHEFIRLRKMESE